MIEYPFLGGTQIGNDADIFLSPQRTVNLYLENGNYRNKSALIGWPGDKRYAGATNRGNARGAHTFKDHAVFVAGTNAYRLDKGGIVTQIGGLTTGSGFVEIAENGLQLMIVDGENGYVWDGSNFTVISDQNYPKTADSVAYLDSAFLVNKPGTGQIYASETLDALTWDELRKAVAEYKSDPVVTLWENRELHLGGSQSTQAYYYSGASPMPFAPIRQGRMIYGVAAKNSVRNLDNTTFALFQDENGGIFVGRVTGFNVVRVSTRGMDRYMSQIDYKDSYAMGIDLWGHEMYLITFPVADHGRGRTFGYSIPTNTWFEVGKYEPTINDFGKFHGRVHLFFDEEHLFFDGRGDIWALDSSSYTIGGEPLIASRTCSVIRSARERVFFNGMMIEADVGHGLNSGQGSDPQIRLEISDDGGRTYPDFIMGDLGAGGEYENEIRFTQLGSSYDRVFRASISDPVPRKFLGAYLE